MSEAYNRRCRETCEWCAKGDIPTKRRVSQFPHDKRDYAYFHWSGRIATGASGSPCTAPTKDEFIEELAAKVTALETFARDVCDSVGVPYGEVSTGPNAALMMVREGMGAIRQREEMEAQLAEAREKLRWVQNTSGGSR